MVHRLPGKLANAYLKTGMKYPETLKSGRITFRGPILRRTRRRVMKRYGAFAGVL